MNKTLITKGQWSSVFDLFDKFCSFNVFFHFLLHQTYFLVFTQIRTRGLKINFVRDWKSWNWKESGKFSLVKLVDSSSLNMRKTFHLPLSCIGCLACLAKMTVCILAQRCMQKYKCYLKPVCWLVYEIEKAARELHESWSHKAPEGEVELG